MKIAAIAAVILLGGVVMFQVALALGAPLGRAAWGGQHGGVLPKRLRIASGAAVVVYSVIILAILASADLIDAGGWIPGAGRPVMWTLTGLFTLGGLANLASRSKIERYWAAVSFAIAGCCAIIA
ncbi:MAG: hypothetical protein GEU78_19875 [Actinobacteria bacterium]|nr:hypothetical protein [Actinomycetota bacterium]